MKLRTLGLFSLLLLICIAVASCGSGGGGSVTAVPPVPPGKEAKVLGCQQGICVSLRQEGGNAIFESDQFDLLDGIMVETTAASEFARADGLHTYKKGGQYCSVTSQKSFSSKQIMVLVGSPIPETISGLYAHKIGDKDNTNILAPPGPTME